MATVQEIQEQVRARYAAAAVSVGAVGPGGPAESGSSCCASAAEAFDEDGEAFGAGLYADAATGGLPQEALLASLGCGNPVGFAYGVDPTDEMLDLARADAVKARATDVKFLQGQIEDLPLADAAVDVVISNCVVNLSGDKPALLAEMFRARVALRDARRVVRATRPAQPALADGSRSR